MEENPYRSPEPVPQVEKPPTRPSKRYLFGLAALFGLSAFGGIVILQAMIVEIVLAQTGMDRSLADVLWMFPVYGLIACPVGVVIVRWALRDPLSSWLFVISSILGTVALVTAISGVLVLLKS